MIHSRLSILLALLVGIATACDHHHHHDHDHHDHDHHDQEHRGLRGQPNFLDDHDHHRQLQGELRSCGAPQPTDEEEAQIQVIVADWVSRHGSNIDNGNNGNGNANGNSGNNGNNGNPSRGLRLLQDCTTFPVTINVHFHVIRELGSGNGNIDPQGAYFKHAKKSFLGYFACAVSNQIVFIYVPPQTVSMFLTPPFSHMDFSLRLLPRPLNSIPSGTMLLKTMMPDPTRLP